MIAKKLTTVAVLVLGLLVLNACNPSTYAESDQKIISARQLPGLIGQPGVVIVDMQSADDYAKGHVAGAVNITRSDIVISVPVENTLASASKLEKTLRAGGISNDTLIVAYDSSKMDAARLFWTLLMYGNENVRVVDGGVSAIKAAGIELTAETPAVTPGSFTAGEKAVQWLATRDDVLAQLDEPDPNVVLLDVRSDEEYASSGKIPSSVMWNYLDNFYADDTFKNTQTTRINYIEKDMRPEKQIIMYCQTSMRASPVFLRLYDAGYRNIRIYDGAYLEWSGNTENPVERPAGAVAPSSKDAS